ncbi:hypothetical protein ACKVV7_003005 [Pyricularia oryzae]|nr:hypothetical protein MCOR26_009895 [Pyricularia oryzae]KAI6320208.1 hypothetical protein MCOR34_003005 [Pyricularia oryzae]
MCSPRHRSTALTLLPRGVDSSCISGLLLQRPRRGPTPATSQSGSLWRTPCIGTLAGHYRVQADYNDYSPQESHPPQQSQSSHAYEPHHPRSLAGPSTLHDPTEHHAHHVSGHSHHPPALHGLPQHRSTPSHHHPVLLDPVQMSSHSGSRHIGHQTPTQYGAGPSPHSVVPPPLYPSMTPTQSGPSSGIKRSRPDDLDLSVPGIAELDQGEMDPMQQSQHMGASYAQSASTPQHHHHRMPETGPPSKMMRRDSQGAGGVGGGAPSVVGQAGMPPPAQRPRGPKLKFTAEDDALLVDLKENKSLTWKQIAEFFPGRSSGTLQVRYCTKLKAKTTQWTEENDQKLRTALQDYEREKWRIVSSKVGTGFTPAACQERAIALEGGAPHGHPLGSPL